MKSRVMWILGIGAVVIVVLVVVMGGGSAPQDPMTGSSEFGIPVQDPVLVAEGDVLYQENCGACHGSDLRGTDIGPSHLSVVYNPDHHGDAAFALAALNGVRSHHWDFGDMAPVPGLSQEDMDRIVAFVRENQRIEGFEPYPPG